MNVLVTENLDGSRLDRALAVLLPELSRSALARLIEEGRVTVAGRLVTKASARVATGDALAVEIPPPLPSTLASQDLPITILYEDELLVVIDKPAGQVVHPAAGHADETLVNALLFHIRDLSGIGGELRPGIVHRLDKDTSGVMVIAKNDEAHRKLTAAWPTEAVRKEYLAVVYGTPPNSRGTIDAPIGRDPGDRKRMGIVAGGRRAVTDYEIVKPLRHSSLLRCFLHTGRTHQIRVHLKSLGYPIIGDPLYSGPQWRGIPDKKLQKAIKEMTRQALHASRLTIPHPRTGQSMTFEAPMPADLAALVAALT